jgi:hypothetical protein
VATSTKLSLVDVSPSMVMRLKLASAASRHQRRQQAGFDDRIGGHEAQHRGHVRPDHAGALAECR